MGGRGSGSGFKAGSPTAAAASTPTATAPAQTATRSSTRATADDAITQWENDSIDAVRAASLASRVERVPITQAIRRVTHTVTIPGVGSIEIRETPLRTTQTISPSTRMVINVWANDESGRTIFDPRTSARFTSVDQADHAARAVLEDHISDRAARRRAALGRT